MGQPPEYVPPVAFMTLAGLLLIFGSLAHIGRQAVDIEHKLEHISAIELDCPDDTLITIVEGGKKTCLVEQENSYGEVSMYKRQKGIKR